MRKLSSGTYISIALALAATVALAMLMSCGDSSKTTPPTTGTVTTYLTDPPTCSFAHAWVTVTRVSANISSSAATTDSGWVDLLNIETAPKQIDLFSTVSTTCVLTQLGSTTGLTPGNYQQIRFYLLSNTPASGQATPTSNSCGTSNGWNCVVVNNPDGTTSTVMLDLSGEDQTGIKIPPGQIAGGGIMLTASQSADLNIIFDACASIVSEGNGMYRLKPTLRAGEVALNNNSISGKVIDGSTSSPIAGAMVLVEQPDPNDATTDRVIEASKTASDGTFIFCPLPNNGTYDVVVDAMVTSALGITTTYNATIAFHVPVGTALATVPLVAEPGGTTGTASQPATITGPVTTSTAAEDVTTSALQDATPTGSSSAMHVTIPLFEAASSTITVTTAPPVAPATCSGSAPDCGNYTVVVPASNPQVGTFSSGSITYSPPATGPVTYSINGTASACSPSSESVSSVTVTAGTTTTVSTAVALTGCT